MTISICAATNDDLQIQIPLRIELQGDGERGTDIIEQDHAWTNESPCCCPECGHEGTVIGFTIKNHEDSASAYREAVATLLDCAHADQEHWLKNGSESLDADQKHALIHTYRSYIRLAEGHNLHGEPDRWQKLIDHLTTKEK